MWVSVSDSSTALHPREHLSRSLRTCLLRLRFRDLVDCARIPARDLDSCYSGYSHLHIYVHWRSNRNCGCCWLPVAYQVDGVVDTDLAASYHASQNARATARLGDSILASGLGLSRGCHLSTLFRKVSSSILCGDV